jgi:hypothetical protein
MKFVLVSFLVLVVLFLSLSCNEGYDYSQAALGLDLQDFSCTEAWIEVQIGSNNKTANIYIKKNDEIIQTVNVGESETLFYFDGLLPNTTYKFDAVTYEDGKEVKSNPVSFTTLDTTSHNFTWQTFTFGDAGAGSSFIYDVAIINENNIWAVGEIYMNDSIGNPDSKIYNAVHWDGTDWELHRIPSVICGTNSPIYSAIFSIYAFSEDNIFYSDGGEIIHFNGQQFIQDCSINSLLTGRINKIWGSSSNDLYAVGNNGNIAHYNGSSWTRIESGTTSIIGDAWGIKDNGESIVYCTVSSFFEPQQDRKILKIVNSKVDSISWKENKLLYSCWTNGDNYLLVCGSGVYQNKSGQWQQENLPSVSMNMVRGNTINDIFIIGDFGLAAHFNGSSWQVYNDGFGDIWGLAFKQNLVAFVGQKNGLGYLEIGKRN